MITMEDMAEGMLSAGSKLVGENDHLRKVNKILLEAVEAAEFWLNKEYDELSVKPVDMLHQLSAAKLAARRQHEQTTE